MADGTKPGTLHLVATPIGNLEDLSFRALRTLKECDLIAAEDTRRTRKLLTHYGISRPLVSYYEHNETKRIPAILDALREGKDVALVSDAGSPGISDPGFRLVREAADQGMPVTALPGPSAVILALSVSGLPADRFSFYGFLPRSGSERKRLLEEAAQVPRTLVFFESPHRIVKTLEDMLDLLGDRRAAVCRELTKRFEQVERDVLSELIAKRKARTPKGEFCIVIEGTFLRVNTTVIHIHRHYCPIHIEHTCRNNAVCPAQQDVLRIPGLISIYQKIANPGCIVIPVVVCVNRFSSNDSRRNASGDL